MMKHVSNGVYKCVSIIHYFTTRKRKILLDKVNFCNKEKRKDGNFIHRYNIDGNTKL